MKHAGGFVVISTSPITRQRAMKIQAMKVEPDNAPQRFTQDEVNDILRRALERQTPDGTITRQELIDTARELGIDQDALSSAISEQRELGALGAAREAWKVKRKQKFFEHLRAYLIVNLILLVFNMVTSESVWFFWPLFGWGIGVAFDASDAFWPKEKEIERGARKLLEKQAEEVRRLERERRKTSKSFVLETKEGKLIIERGDRRIEIG